MFAPAADAYCSSSNFSCCLRAWRAASLREPAAFLLRRPPIVPIAPEAIAPPAGPPKIPPKMPPIP